MSKMKTLIGSPEPEDQTARYRREYTGLMRDAATVMRKSVRLTGRR